MSGTGPDMRVDLGGIAMPNPVAVASGTFGYGQEYADLVDISRLGAVIVKGIRRIPWPGNPLPRLVELETGLVNAIGLQGPGVEGFIEQYLPFLRGTGAPVIVNLWGETIEEYAEVAARLDDVEGVHGLELNISCPNVQAGGASFGADPRRAAALVRAVRRRTARPILPKLPPNVPDIGWLARAVVEAGADAVSLINTLPAMVIDIETRRPVLGNRVGGLSGPAIHPVAVKLVYETAQAVSVPVLAMGGISGPEDAIEFLIAGASAVAVGTANFSDPGAALRVLDGIRAYLERHRLSSCRALTGSLAT